MYIISIYLKEREREERNKTKSARSSISKKPIKYQGLKIAI